MSKLTKLFRIPGRFFGYAIRNRLGPPSFVGGATTRKALLALQKVLAIEESIQACQRIEPHVRYAYLPWIRTHGDALFSRINAQEDLCRPVPLVRRSEDPTARKEAARAVCTRPDLYRRLCLKVFSQLPGHVRGVLFSVDWHPVMRQAAYARMLARLKVASGCKQDVTCWVGKLSDDDAAIRARAAHKLGMLGGAEQAAALADAAVHKVNDEEDIAARYQALLSIDWIAAKGAIPDAAAIAEKLEELVAKEKTRRFTAAVNEEAKRLAIRLRRSANKG